ncbi:MAG: hypothetical protein WC455_24140 [Dehalococcoidia bacterium]|jgi:hypothetical protein
MAKAKTAFPLDGIGGTIQGNDRTIGRNKGLTSTVVQNTTQTRDDKKEGLSVKLVSQKAPTRGGSVNRHTRAERYCFCDKSYTLLTKEKQSFLEPWWKAVSERSIIHMSGHSVLMKICLKYLAEYDAFLEFSYCSRYWVTNSELDAWTNHKVILEEIPTYQADGQDLQVYQLLQKTTKKGSITYDPRMIDMRLVHEVTERGKAMVTIPSLAPGSTLWVDVYSYFRRIEDGS